MSGIATGPAPGSAITTGPAPGSAPSTAAGHGGPSFDRTRRTSFRLAAVFSDHMVLQLGEPIALFGTGKAGTLLTAVIQAEANQPDRPDRPDQPDASEDANARAGCGSAMPTPSPRVENAPHADAAADGPLSGESSTIVADSGAWLTHLPAMPAGGPYRLTLSDGTERITVHDVWIGEVWLAGGQSNMELELRNSEHGEQAVAASNDPLLRFYNTPKTGEVNPSAEAESGWCACSPQTSGYMSAVAYYFARKLRRELGDGVPIGIVDCYIGGTSISCWMSHDALCSSEAGRGYWQRFERSIAGKTAEQFAEETGAWQTRFDAWNAAVSEARQIDPDVTWEVLNARLGPCPWPPPITPTSQYRPTGPYETMLRRVAPFTLRGFLWYQGEEDEAYCDDYRELLGTLIDEWRALWRRSGDCGCTVHSSTAHGGTVQSGTIQSDTVQSDTIQSGTVQTSTAHSGTVQNATVHSSTIHSNTVQNGTIQSGTVQTGTIHSSTAHSNTVQNGTVHSSTVHGSTAHGDHRGDEPASLPFLIAQLPQWIDRATFEADADPLHWPVIREAQWDAAQTMPHVHTVPLIDCGEFDNIHPVDKRTPGERLADMALATVYGRTDVPHRNPTFLSARMEPIEPSDDRATNPGANPVADPGTEPGTAPGTKPVADPGTELGTNPTLRISGVHADTAPRDRIRIHFLHAEGLRFAGGDDVSCDAASSGFELAGNDGVFHPASAVILDGAVIVESAQVVRPCAVRYAWASWGPAPLRNADGLPAPPFRSSIG
ncbi:9-O-acetylesterase [Bifidobacterium lemurum]|uniref:9-O-acetylesterase n=1 Tax=Bifidobacterium lemurum TaxID=1603886 RepID=A0A261FVN4_9BIFI|nr:hypothetical protein [Bifidobacterium lemurum]OZG62826.1 9-O-acetylesterase [Bifidobacterium lemurum]